MAVSKFTSSSNVNDFNLSIGSTYSVVTLNQEYPLGAYSFISSLNDITMDLYFYNGTGTLVGYTNTKGVILTGGFNKVVVIGGTVGDVLGFTYKTTFTTTSETTEVTAGPVILSTSPTSLPNVDSSTTVTGLNFATDITASFTGSDNLVRPAKSLVRGSATSLVVTRPDTLPVAYSPYTLTVINPSVAYQPTGSAANTISVTAGVVPVWQTSATLSNFIKTQSYSATVSATDADGGSSITYSVVSGSLPTGISFNTSTGIISGTPTNNSGNPYSYTIRATDSGGNYADRTFTLSQVVPDAPTIGTVTLNVSTGTASIPFTAPTYAGTSTITTYTATSSPAGYSGTLSQAGSGTITVTGITGTTAYTFTVTATNSGGTSLASTASNPVSLPYAYTGTGSVQSFTMPAGKTSAIFKIWGAGGGGTNGGSGGYTTGTYTLVGGRSYNIYVGKTAGKGSTGGYPGGGGGGNTTNAGYGYGGGGYSGVQDSTNSTYLAIAGAGGGATASNGGPVGRGGGTSGESVSNGYGTNGGGTQSAGGSVGITVDTTATAGGSLTGGRAVDSGTGSWTGGGGGGAGYYGGAGGETGGGAVTGGAGGSGYVNTSYTSNGTTVVGVGSDADQGTSGNPNNDGKVLIYVQ